MRILWSWQKKRRRGEGKRAQPIATFFALGSCIISSLLYIVLLSALASAEQENGRGKSPCHVFQGAKVPSSCLRMWIFAKVFCSDRGNEVRVRHQPAFSPRLYVHLEICSSIQFTYMTDDSAMRGTRRRIRRHGRDLIGALGEVNSPVLAPAASSPASDLPSLPPIVLPEEQQQQQGETVIIRESGADTPPVVAPATASAGAGNNADNSASLTPVTSSNTAAYTTEALADEILPGTLPGLEGRDNMTFRQFSGYLPITSNKNIFYWYVEAIQDADKAPLVFWTNGGPGCSGLFGFMNENGPFRPGKDGEKLEINPYSWNRVANMLYVEQPGESRRREKRRRRVRNRTHDGNCFHFQGRVFAIHGF